MAIFTDVQYCTYADQKSDNLIYMIRWLAGQWAFGTMALPVVEFSRQGYKIGKVFA